VRRLTLEDIKRSETQKKGTFLRRGQSIKLSSNAWDSMHQRKLSKSTLKKLPGVQISPRALKLPEVASELKPSTQRFMEKV